MTDPFTRTQRLLGKEAMGILAGARVAVFGIGGVGGYVAEALARSGVGTLDLVDSDRICLSNLNRQIIALHSTLGRYKVDVMKERILDINPEAVIHAHRCFFLPENRDEFDFSQYSYVVDAVDTVTAKIGLVLCAQEAGVPVISSMGAGNKLDPAGFQVADLYETSVCPLARVMRRELKKRGVKKLKVVYSREEPLTPLPSLEDEEEASEEGLGEGAAPVFQAGSRGRRSTPGSTAFVPSVAGLILAGEVIRDLTEAATARSRRQEVIE